MKFVPTDEMVAAAQAVFLAMTLEQTVTPVVLKYQRQLLAEGQWRVRPEYAARLGDEVITEPHRAYLMSEADFALYDAKCKQARDAAGLSVDHPDQCPSLVAQDLQRQAERALIDAMSSTTKITHQQLLCSPDGLATLRQYIDLTLRLLVPFLKTKPLSSQPLTS
jgi:hypothetical protein